MGLISHDLLIDIVSKLSSIALNLHTSMAADERMIMLVQQKKTYDAVVKRAYQQFIS